MVIVDTARHHRSFRLLEVGVVACVVVAENAAYLSVHSVCLQTEVACGLPHGAQSSCFVEEIVLYRLGLAKQRAVLAVGDRHILSAQSLIFEAHASLELEG